MYINIKLYNEYLLLICLKITRSILIYILEFVLTRIKKV